jgi:hypothetical protein
LQPVAVLPKKEVVVAPIEREWWGTKINSIEKSNFAK